MNERIRELAEQVGITENNLSDGDMSHDDLKKFAKLIIRECADFVAAGEFGDPGTAKQLMEYFGVEEKTK
jgi:hypothetical protein